MNAIEMLKAAIQKQACDDDTFQQYAFWIRATDCAIDVYDRFVSLYPCNSLKSITLGSLASRPCRVFLRGTVAGRAGRLLSATMKTIPLTQGFSAIINDDDFDAVSKYKWHAVRLGSRKNPYARRTDYSLGRRNKKQVFMHHFILGITGFIDHKNGNTLDNQRDNLRPCSRQQNGFNRTVTSKQNGKPTRFKGICWHRKMNKWQASIGLNGRKIHIGYFYFEADAAKAYNDKAVQLFGEFAAINNLTSPMDFGRQFRAQIPPPQICFDN